TGGSADRWAAGHDVQGAGTGHGQAGREAPDHAGIGLAQLRGVTEVPVLGAGLVDRDRIVLGLAIAQLLVWRIGHAGPGIVVGHRIVADRDAQPAAPGAGPGQERGGDERVAPRQQRDDDVLHRPFVGAAGGALEVVVPVPVLVHVDEDVEEDLARHAAVVRRIREARDRAGGERERRRDAGIRAPVALVLPKGHGEGGLGTVYRE